MNPKCGNCKKTVYPVEKLNLLDQAWHKGCFKCDTCSLTLNVKNYKGYDGRPYCNTHYPTTKFTSVAETPEMNRIKKNTENQSAIRYTQNQRELQGTKLSVAEDPETARIKKNTANQSMAKYHNLASQRNQENYRRSEEAENLAGTNRQDLPRQPAPQEKQQQPLPPPPVEQYDEPEPVGKPQEQRNVGSLFGQEQPGPPMSPPPVQAPAGYTQQGARYTAIYDYAAAAEDEVSFNEGDVIVNGEVIDDGWMTGTVERTGAAGMLPSNYVEPI